MILQPLFQHIEAANLFDVMEVTNTAPDPAELFERDVKGTLLQLYLPEDKGQPIEAINRPRQEIATIIPMIIGAPTGHPKMQDEHPVILLKNALIQHCIGFSFGSHYQPLALAFARPAAMSPTYTFYEIEFQTSLVLRTQ